MPRRSARFCAGHTGLTGSSGGAAGGYSSWPPRASSAPIKVRFGGSANTGSKPRSQPVLHSRSVRQLTDEADPHVVRAVGVFDVGVSVEEPATGEDRGAAHRPDRPATATRHLFPQELAVLRVE